MYIGGLDEYPSLIDVQVYDLRGRLIIQRVNHRPTDYISLPSMANGIYIVRVFFPLTHFKPIVIKQFIHG